RVILQEPPLLGTELAATLLQGAITTGLAVLCAHLYVRFQRPWFGWFAVAWSVYVARLLCISLFLLSDQRVWLYWHQVTTGWTALVLLWAAIVFLRQPPARPWYLLVALFPPLWSWVAIYSLDSFILAALPAVLFLSAATAWTGWVFWRHNKMVGSSGARLLAISFALWGLHHLDYPFLRAQGAWTPWGYYLDICFELLVGAGLVLLVLDDLARGVRALSALSGDLHRRDSVGDSLDTLLSRPLTLAGVRGSAMYLLSDTDAKAAPEKSASESGGHFVRGAGTCAGWPNSQPDSPVASVLARMRATQRPQVAIGTGDQPFVAALPVSRGKRLIGALVMSGDVRNPFTALDDNFLVALGQQVGAALEQADLDRQLAARTRSLEQLSMRMVRQHEDERRRLSRELHDETAQVFTAVKMQLEGLRQSLLPNAITRLDRLLALVDTGIRSIRNVTNELRPSLLDDLGLLPALRSLVSDFSERTGVRAVLDAPEQLPEMSQEADLALYRALQEALSNVARHAKATMVKIVVKTDDDSLRLTVADDGAGFKMGADGRMDSNSRMGLTGMQERIHAVGGQVTFANVPALAATFGAGANGNASHTATSNNGSTNRTTGAEVRVQLPLTVPELV
ncbi:MAG: GAF domain-containing sensor histidine kinase, partial [Phycisphaerae bacterium]|nr:GAF domain-containing sensor histidine kinase [Gemmatimonadaceae bacterium]